VKRVCVIFNPTARGERALRFKKFLEGIPGGVELNPTQAPGHAIELACAAVDDGVEDIVAAGGDGTLNEVLNGIGRARNGFERARLGVLPLGTVNVFAKELRIPEDPKHAWETILSGHERTIDLPYSDADGESGTQRRYFAQLAGAGLDASAIELVDWKSKRRFGQLAYLFAGLRALARPPKRVKIFCGARETEGELVLVGNGKFYGGRWNVFPEASLTDGKIDICVFPRVNLWTALRFGCSLLAGNRKVSNSISYFQANEVRMTSDNGAQFELEGDLIGPLPVTMGVLPTALRVICPA
jgi:diacylglycerol kinase (ATP)